MHLLSKLLQVNMYLSHINPRNTNLCVMGGSFKDSWNTVSLHGHQHQSGNYKKMKTQNGEQEQGDHVNHVTPACSQLYSHYIL